MEARRVGPERTEGEAASPIPRKRLACLSFASTVGELTEQPKEPSEQSKAPETSATLVDSSDSELMAEGHLPLQETPSSVWPEGRLDMEEPLSGWPWVPLDMDDTHKDQEPSPNKKWDIILKEGPPCSIDLDA